MLDVCQKVTETGKRGDDMAKRVEIEGRTEWMSTQQPHTCLWLKGKSLECHPALLWWNLREFYPSFHIRAQTEPAPLCSWILAGWAVSVETKTRWAERDTLPETYTEDTYARQTHENPNSLKARLHLIYLSWTHMYAEESFCLPVGSPSQSDMAGERRGSVSSVTSWVSGDCCFLWVRASLFSLFSVLGSEFSDSWSV